MMKSTIAFIVCVWLAQSAQAQVIGLGKCPNVTAVENFKISDYYGTWYKYSAYFFLPEAGAKCTTTTFAESSTPGTYNIDTVAYRLGTKISIKGTGKPASNDNSGKFTLKLDLSPLTYPAYILGADSTSYVVVWACGNVGSIANNQQAWIITRDRKPSKEVIDAAYAAMTENKLSTSKLGLVDQSSC